MFQKVRHKGMSSRTVVELEAMAEAHDFVRELTTVKNIGNVTDPAGGLMEEVGKSMEELDPTQSGFGSGKVAKGVAKGMKLVDVALLIKMGLEVDWSSEEERNAFVETSVEVAVGNIPLVGGFLGFMIEDAKNGGITDLSNKILVDSYSINKNRQNGFVRQLRHASSSSSMEKHEARMEELREKRAEKKAAQDRTNKSNAIRMINETLYINNDN